VSLIKKLEEGHRASQLYIILISILDSIVKPFSFIFCEVVELASKEYKF